MSEIPQPQKSVWPIFVFGLIALALFLIGTVVLLSFSGPAPDEGAARSQERAKAYADLQAENKKQLETYAWADKAKGTVQIPIDAAIQLTLLRLQSQQPVPAGPITLPATPAAAPAVATPAPEAAATPVAEPAATPTTPAGEPATP